MNFAYTEEMDMIRESYLKTIDENVATAGRLKRTMHMLGTVRLLLAGGLIALWIVFGNVYGEFHELSQ